MLGHLLLAWLWALLWPPHSVYESLLLLLLLISLILLQYCWLLDCVYDLLHQLLLPVAPTLLLAELLLLLLLLLKLLLPLPNLT